MKAYLLLPALKVHNANAMSSPYTAGFPAMTAWLGGMHALQRKIHAVGMENIFFTGAAVSCHQFDMQVFRDSNARYPSIIGTANPLNKDGKRPSFVQEARCHLTVSLLFETEGVNGDNEEDFLTCVRQVLPEMKWAGGDLENNASDVALKMLYADEGNSRDIRKVRRSLMPGFVLLERRSRLQNRKDGESIFEAFLRNLSVKATPRCAEDGELQGWDYARESDGGWIVPVAVGYRDLSGSVSVGMHRDGKTEHHFAEPLVTLGEFVLPIRCESIDEMMWRYSYDPVKSLYCCANEQTAEKVTE